MQHFNKINNQIIRKKKIISNIFKCFDLSKYILIAVKEFFYSKSNLYFSLKITGIFSLIFIFFIGTSSVGNTVSYFNDTEISTENKLQAGVLDFNILEVINDLDIQKFANPQSVDALVIEEDIGSKNFNIKIEESDNSLPSSYIVSGFLNIDNPIGCERMEIEAIFGEYIYSGLLSSFTSSQISDKGEWQFVASLPQGSTDLLPSVLCRGEIIFNAGLGEVPVELINTFSNEKRYPFELKNWSENVYIETTDNVDVLNIPQQVEIELEVEDIPIKEEEKVEDTISNENVVLEEEIIIEEKQEDESTITPVVEETIQNVESPEESISI